MSQCLCSVAVWASIAAGLATAGACRTAAPPAAQGLSRRPVAAPLPPRTAADCRACRGLWAVHGISDRESCVCRTNDAGKRCRDGAECEGACVAASQDPEREIVQVGPPARGYFIGRCSELMTVFGCNRFIEAGTAANGPALLSEPPAMMCVD